MVPSINQTAPLRGIKKEEKESHQEQTMELKQRVVKSTICLLKKLLKAFVLPPFTRNMFDNTAVLYAIDIRLMERRGVPV